MRDVSRSISLSLSRARASYLRPAPACAILNNESLKLNSPTKNMCAFTRANGLAGKCAIAATKCFGCNQQKHQRSKTGDRHRAWRISSQADIPPARQPSIFSRAHLPIARQSQLVTQPPTGQWLDDWSPLVWPRARPHREFSHHPGEIAGGRADGAKVKGGRARERRFLLLIPASRRVRRRRRGRRRPVVSPISAVTLGLESGGLNSRART